MRGITAALIMDQLIHKRSPWGVLHGEGPASFADHPRSCSMDLDLADKVVVVTGASRGVGLATVQSFVQEGAIVVAGARTVSTALQELAAHAQVLPVSVDLAT